MDEFLVVHDVYGEELTAPLTAADFDEVRVCLKRLSLVMQVEEAFDVAVSNYAEIERAIANAVISREVRRDVSDARWRATARDMSRVFSNLLSSVRTFQHVAESAVSEIYGGEALQSHQAFKSELYDTSFAYRVMERLRNHAQHQGLAVSNQTYSSRWLDIPGREDRRRVQTFTPELDLEELGRLPKWRALAKEFAAMRVADATAPKRLSLLRLVRIYMSEQSQIMVALRKAVADDLGTWEAAIFARRDRIPDRDDSLSITGTIVVRRRAGEAVERLYVSKTVLEDIRQLQQENRPLRRLDLLEMRL